MRMRLIATTLIASTIMAAGLLVSSCSTAGRAPNNNTANANSSQSQQAGGGLPSDAKPMGQTAPGFYSAGPTGDVTVRFTSPQNDQVIEGRSVSPTFTVSGYPIYQDTSRDKGQHIHVILDNEPYEPNYDPNTPFSPEKFKNLKPGTHTLRAYPSREWHESIKEPDGSSFDMVVFHVGERTPGLKIDRTAPLLTYSRPKGEYRWKEDPRGLMIDFYVTNATIGINDYKIKYTVNGKSKIASRWEPIWMQWEELGPGKHEIILELLDKDNKSVSFKVGATDYNRTERTFTILREGEVPSAGAANRNGNRP